MKKMGCLSFGEQASAFIQFAMPHRERIISFERMFSYKVNLQHLKPSILDSIELVFSAVPLRTTFAGS